MNSAIREQKKQLRNSILLSRAQLSPLAKSAYDNWVCKELYQWVEERKANIIHTFLPIKNEIDLRPLLQQWLDEDKQLFAPQALSGRKMKHYSFTSFENLATGFGGTVYPKNAQAYEGEPEVIIVPGLACDEAHFRLGYGGGYYDTFLAAHPNSETVAAFYPPEKYKKLPVEPHDKPLDHLIWKANW